MSKKVIGILGGMGPLATADLFQKITLHTVAACDQAHPRVCIDSNTDIADRTAALLHGGPSTGSTAISTGEHPSNVSPSSNSLSG